jgi:peptidoglycan/LPS O-acetylase OafA/YrhL
MERRERLVGLDILRGIAILLVLGRHFPSRNFADGGIVSRFFAGWNAMGWTGVDLFFVLSGFLVSGLLFTEIRERGYADLPRFLVRRSFKIYPSYWVLLAVTFCALGRMPAPAEAGKYLFLVQNYLGFDDLLLHTWSLAVEEHVYLLLTLSLWVLSFRGRASTNIERLTPFVAVLVCVSALLLRFDYSNSHPYVWSKQMTLTHLRIDALSFGLLLSWTYHFRRGWFDLVFGRYGAALSVLGVCLLGTALFFNVDGSYFMHVYGFVATYIGAGLLVGTAAVSGRPQCSKVAATFSTWVGKPSYSIYLWHVILSHFLATQLETLHLPPAMIDLVFLGASVVVGNVMFEVLESPALRLRDRVRFNRPVPVSIGVAADVEISEREAR